MPIIRRSWPALKTVAIKQMSDLDGKKVAVVRGTTQDTDLTRQAKGAQLVRYEDDATMALAFASGQVDVLATARSLLPAISKKNPARTLEPKITMQTFYLAIGMRKDEPKLLDWVNNWVQDQPPERQAGRDLQDLSRHRDRSGAAAQGRRLSGGAAELCRTSSISRSWPDKLARLRGRRLAHHAAHRGVDRARLRAGHDVRARPRLRRAACCGASSASMSR